MSEATCARAGCTEPVGRCYRTTSEAHARLCVRHRHSQAVMDAHAKRVAANWRAEDINRSVRVYDSELRGVAMHTPAGVRWLLARGQRIVATRGGYESRAAAERACDEARAKGRAKGAAK